MSSHKENNDGGNNGKPVSGSQKANAELILKGNFKNLAKKVIEGKTLSSFEVALLKQESGGAEGDVVDGVEYAKNQAQLANILGVSRKTIQRYIKREGAPKSRDDGRLSITEWRAFLAKHDVLGDEADTPDATRLKAEQILLQNKLLQQKID